MRDYTKFFTLPGTALFMAKLLDCTGGELVLEPSAGDGALVTALQLVCHDTFIVAVEVNDIWRECLKEAGASKVIIQDFLTYQPGLRFNCCIANPPFGNETDLDAHFEHMCSLTVKGGNMVMLLPDDFKVVKRHEAYPLKNWGSNKDGSVTPIKIVKFKN